MGTAIQAILAGVTAFGFTQALIRMPRHDHNAYSTAFTLNAIAGAAIALALIAAILPALHWYGDQRVTQVLMVLAATSFISGFRNSGLVRYERALDFRPFFVIGLARKASSFLVAAVCALMWHDYRALLAGMLASAFVETAISFRLTRFRPRFTLVKSRQLLGFSAWWLAGQATSMLGRRGQDILVGQRLGATSLGQYAVALDLATMATMEIVAPVMRAVYPGYMQMKDDAGRLFSAFVRVWGVIALLAFPTAAGMACLSRLIAEVVLGPNWVGAAQLMTFLAIIGGLQALSSCYWPMLLTRLGPKAHFKLAILSFVLTIPSFALALWLAGLLAAIAAWICCTLVMLFVGASLLVKDLRGTYGPLFRTLVRPTIGAAVMVLALLAIQPLFVIGTLWFARAAALLLLVVFGALIYAAAVTCLWLAAGRPQGAESEFLFAVWKRLAPM
jgi:PST family polysaccharide transporter